MDIVYLHGLEVDAVIGVFDWERKIRQTVLIDLDMASDVARAAKTDHLEDTLDYKSVAKRVREFVSDSSFQLVETLAERIAEIVRHEYHVPWVRVKINKREIVRHEYHVPWVRVKINKRGAITGATSVGVIIERGKPD